MKTTRAVRPEQAQKVADLLHALLRELAIGLHDPAVEMPLAQLRVCNVLHDGPRSMSALGRELGVSLSAITQIADRLERVGLVNRVVRRTDRRVRSLQLTEHGEKMIRRHDEVRIQRMASLLEHLTSKAREEAAATLETLIRRGGRHKGRRRRRRRADKRLPSFNFQGAAVKTISGLLVAVAIAAGGAAYYATYRNAEPPMTFRRRRSNATTLLVTIDATGTAEPEDLIDVGTQVTGRILSFGPDPHNPNKTIDYGTAVEEDTVLAIIDPTIYNAQVDQADAALAHAQGQFAGA